MTTTSTHATCPVCHLGTLVGEARDAHGHGSAEHVAAIAAWKSADNRDASGRSTTHVGCDFDFATPLVRFA